MSKLVSKAVFLAARECPTKGWYQRHVGAPFTLGDEMRAEQGQRVGELARSVFPAGELIDAASLEDAARQTDLALNNPDVKAIFEATFLQGDYVAKADILCREGLDWRLIEVKSGTKVSDDYVADLAYTAKVLGDRGLSLSRASLWTVSPDYRRGMSANELFIETDCTPQVTDMLETYEIEWDHLSAQILAPAHPRPDLILSCRSCQFFKTNCLGKGVDHHILELPRLNEHLFQHLVQQGMTSIADIRDDSELPERYRVVTQAVRTGKPVVDKAGLVARLAEVNWPAFYLDFETVNTCLPLYDDCAPYEQIPTQYSIHVYSDVTQLNDHREYLSDSARDCQRDLAAGLLRDLEGAGSIVVYSPFESRVIRQLRDKFPDLAPGLIRLIERIFDLEKAIRACVYHPGFHGKTSIKLTLPALTDLTYDDLAIQNGDAASAAFYQLATGTIDGDEAQALRANLLEYCKQDTLAMVRIHSALTKLAAE